MENLYIMKTKSTPEINFDLSTHNHSIRGESYPENTFTFYDPIFQWIENYIETLEQQEVIFTIELIYFNSSSSKVLMDMFDIFDEASKEGKNITVNWIHDEEDEALQEYGEEFKEDLPHLTFIIKSKV
ncbi:MAG: hypothetical protein DRG30_04425 [Epsilonproteobacteria bacterium]|nr:MAG: hypothetical protein DRG30_04425 [Campylobacterota bacterium]